MPTIFLISYGLDDELRDEAGLTALLHPSERAKAARFVYPYLQRRYRVGRAVLRAVLGHVTGLPPAKLMFEVGPQGKPMLPRGPSFNVSHSEGRLLLAVALGGRLGVDVELRRAVHDIDAIARANFAPDEAEAVLATQPGQREEAFLETWTRKEALIKAVGGGLSIPLSSFSVAVGQADGNLLRRLDLPGESLPDWSLRAVPGVPGAVAAVALDAPYFEFEWLPPELAFP